MARVLIVAEHDGQSLNPSTARCVSCARSFEASAIDIAVLSGDGGAVAAQAAALAGVTGVIRVDHPANEFALAAVAAPQIRDLAADYTHVFGPSTTFGKDLMPRVAALMGVGQLSDIMSAESAYRFKRPIYAGNAILTVEAPADRTVVATVRTASYQAAEATGEAEIRKRSMDTELPDHTRFIELRSDTGNGRPDLQTGARVVSGGRALGSKENFEIIYRLADTLGAAVGASRAAVDSGYAGKRHAGRPDRKDHCAGPLYRRGYLRSHPAPYRNQGRRHDRGHQHRCGGAAVRGRRYRSGGGSVHRRAGTDRSAGRLTRQWRRRPCCLLSIDHLPRSSVAVRIALTGANLALTLMLAVPVRISVVWAMPAAPGVLQVVHGRRQQRMRMLRGSYIGVDDTSAGTRSPATSMLKPPSAGFGALAVSTYPSPMAAPRVWP